MASRSLNDSRSITARRCVPLPISSSPSCADTLNSMRFPSTPTTSAVARTVRPTGVAARCFTSTAVPTAPSPASGNGLRAIEHRVLRDEDHHRRLPTPLAAASRRPKRLARCSGCTRNVAVPVSSHGGSASASSMSGWRCSIFVNGTTDAPELRGSMVLPSCWSSQRRASCSSAKTRIGRTDGARSRKRRALLGDVAGASERWRSGRCRC